MFHGCSIDVTPVTLGRIIPRKDVPVGHVFKYKSTANSEGYMYAHLDKFDSIMYSLKFDKYAKSSTTSTPMTYTSTPDTSPRMSNEVEIVGYYNFTVTLQKVPEVVPLSSIKNAQTAVSFRNDFDEQDYPHIYLVLGETSARNSSHYPVSENRLLLKLTKNFSIDKTKWCALSSMHESTMSAIRGTVGVNIYEGGE